MQPKRHFIALDGLRGVAALAVVFLHFGEAFPRFAFSSQSQLAVDFFFMLSGFVIGYAYEEKLQGGMGFGRFAAIRLVRLYPMVFLGVILCVVSRFVDGAAGASTASVLGAAMFALLMLPTPRSSAKPVSAFPLNGPLWSLTFELISNFVYAAVVKRLTTPILTVFAIVMAAGLIWTACAVGQLDFGMAWSRTSWLGLVRVFCPFTIGLLLYRVAGHFRPKSNLLSVAAVLLLALVLWLPVTNGRFYDLVAVLVVFPVIVLLAMRSPDDGPLRRIWAWLGGISYPVYAINQPFFRIAAATVQHARLTGSAEVAIEIASLIFCIGFAVLALQLYDAPVRSWLSQRFLRRSRPDRVMSGDDKAILPV